MERVGYFLAGFASGWAVRTTVDSSRNLAVRVIAGFYGAVDRASRAVGMEREHLEDLLAEARAKYEMDRARAARGGASDTMGDSASPAQAGSAKAPPSSRPAAVGARDRAA